MKIKHLFLLLIIACSTKTEEPDVMYKKSIDALQDQKYETATKLLEKMDEEYPYTSYANNVSVLLTYTYFRKKEYSMLIPIVDIYVKTNPRSPDVPYMLYIKALSYYSQIKSYKKDREILLEFKNITDFLSDQYPHSIYTKDLQEKYPFVMDILFLSEFHAGLQYQRKKSCGAAISRYLNIQNIETSYSDDVKQNLEFCFNYLNIKSDL